MDFLPFLIREDLTALLSLSWIWTLSVSSSAMVLEASCDRWDLKPSSGARAGH